MTELSAMTSIPLENIQTARDNLKRLGLQKTPLIPLDCHVPGKKIYLKCENLQPTKSFKIRGASNAMSCVPRTSLDEGVYTASAGNFAQGLAWSASRLGVTCSVVVPDTAPDIKVQAIQQLGAQTRHVPFDVWWDVMETGRYDGLPGRFFHPVCDRNVIAGNGTIGLEILEDLPTVDAVVCAWGGGGHCTGIASAFKALKPSVTVTACEVDTGAPLTTSLRAGKPSRVANHRPSFVDGMNGKSQFPDMWGLARSLVSDTVVLSGAEICDAIRLIVAKNALVAEGAGAATVAAALTDGVPPGNIVCVLSGGNIAPHVLVEILQGKGFE